MREPCSDCVNGKCDMNCGPCLPSAEIIKRPRELKPGNVEKFPLRIKLLDLMPSAMIPERDLSIDSARWREGYLVPADRCSHIHKRFINRWRCVDCGTLL